MFYDIPDIWPDLTKALLSDPPHVMRITGIPSVHGPESAPKYAGCCLVITRINPVSVKDVRIYEFTNLARLMLEMQ